MTQKVLITAAASGIGSEIARAFSVAGAKVFITDINTQALEAAKKEIPGVMTKVTSCSMGMANSSIKESGNSYQGFMRAYAAWVTTNTKSRCAISRHNDIQT